MAVEGVYVILACSREMWAEFSSGTSLNKQCLRLIINDGRAVVEISLHTLFLCVEMSRVSVMGVVSFISLQ